MRFDNHLVMVRDAWSKRFSLPGGTAQRGESADFTASRETLEETGIAVRVHPFHQKLKNGFFLFFCEPTQTIQVRKTNNPSELISGTEPIQKILNLSISTQQEILEAVLIDPERIPLDQWRFPSQRLEVLNAFHRNPSLSLDWIVSVEDLSAEARLESQFGGELKWMKNLQDQFSKPIYLALAKFFSAIGEELFLYLFLTSLWFFLPWKTGFEGTLFCLGSALLNGSLKEIFKIPRPFDFWPDLQLSTATGYGFPSGHTQVVTALWLFLALRTRLPGRWWLGLLISIGVGVSRVYLGVHFPHDVLGGWILGALTIALFLALGRYRKFDLFFGAAALLSLFLNFDPLSLSLCSILLGILFGVRLRGDSSFSEPPLQQRTAQILSFGIALSGLGVIFYFAKIANPGEGAFFPILLHRIIKYFTVGFWLSYASFKVIDWLNLGASAQSTQPTQALR